MAQCTLMPFIYIPSCFLFVQFAYLLCTYIDIFKLACLRVCYKYEDSSSQIFYTVCPKSRG